MMTCIVCGCTDQAACVDSETGETCGWSWWRPGDGKGMCTFCGETHIPEPPLVELVTESEADLFIRARRAGA
jgi:hypothetical protein